ncbi:MAG: hypothetical protein GX345_05985 [Clostridiales bacterium]|nr:hypothetical protein [Clostridiales bacterium]
MADFKWEIVESIGVISENPKGWTKEFNMVSWNGRDAKYDIREWSPDHETMSKGLTFTKDEILALKDLLNNLDIE